MKPISFVLFLFSTSLLLSCGSTKSLPNEASDTNVNKEDMVNWGYGEVQKDKTSKSVSRLVNKDNEAAQYNNMYDYLAGKVPGVNVSGRKILIRGVTSIYGSTDPLIVVDGIPTDNLDDILPIDVSTVDVLKGPEATIYGVRGANGVIIITTKRGGDH